MIHSVQTVCLSCMNKPSVCLCFSESDDAVSWFNITQVVILDNPALWLAGVCFGVTCVTWWRGVQCSLCVSSEVEISGCVAAERCTVFTSCSLSLSAGRGLWLLPETQTAVIGYRSRQEVILSRGRPPLPVIWMKLKRSWLWVFVCDDNNKSSVIFLETWEKRRGGE